jgi:polycystin 1L2
LYGGNSKCLTVRVPSIQKQTNGIDCGLFAVANAVHFCIGGYIGKRLIVYDTEYLRDYLLFCLDKGQVTPFPRVETKAKLNKKRITYIDIQCDRSKCGLPNLLQKMVGCDTADKHCKIWQHLNCDSRTGREYG